METIGIIAEYNPFHNGHAYQITEIRRRTGARFVIAAISGDFVQRGTPAIIDKYTRTRMALSCGADLVLELPCLWATASAEYFAAAGVTLFDKTGCTDAICFGAETEDLPLLNAAATLLAHEPEGYRNLLAFYLKEGLNFPMARAKALSGYLKNVWPGLDPSISGPPASSPAAGRSPEAFFSAISTPNNILAIEYLKALECRHSSLSPLLLKREGAGYHDTSIHVKNASATAIRRLLLASSGSFDAGSVHMLKNAMPQTVYDVLNSYLAENPPLFAEDFSCILSYLLLSASQESLAAVGDCTKAIANRIYKNRFCCHSFAEFCGQNKSRDVTYTRISRILLHILLNITNDDYIKFRAADYIPYLRILGFRRDAAELLTRLKANASVPIISKLASAPSQLSASAFSLLEKDIFAAELYDQIRFGKSFHNRELSVEKKITPSRSEYTRKVVIF